MSSSSLEIQFGAQLRGLRQERSWRQIDLAERLGAGIARSTIANVELGRYPPTPRLWEALRRHFPEWEQPLAAAYDETVATRTETIRRLTLATVARDFRDAPTNLLGGPFLAESIRYVYLFRHSRSPEEIIEVRRVRALRSGVTGYGLFFSRGDSADTMIEQEAIWGGQLTQSEVHVEGSAVAFLQRFEFDRRLRRGQVHEFALRTWITRDPDPGTTVDFRLTLPARQVSFDLHFRGPQTPRAFWLHRGDRSGAEPAPPAHPDDPAWLESSPEGDVSKTWQEPELYVEHGIGWEW